MLCPDIEFVEERELAAHFAIASVRDDAIAALRDAFVAEPEIWDIAMASDAALHRAVSPQDMSDPRAKLEAALTRAVR